MRNCEYSFADIITKDLFELFFQCWDDFHRLKFMTAFKIVYMTLIVWNDEIYSNVFIFALLFLQTFVKVLRLARNRAPQVRTNGFWALISMNFRSFCCFTFNSYHFRKCMDFASSRHCLDKKLLVKVGYKVWPFTSADSCSDKESIR